MQERVKHTIQPRQIERNQEKMMGADLAAHQEDEQGTNSQCKPLLEGNLFRAEVRV
jgi:hypothetical protein